MFILWNFHILFSWGSNLFSLFFWCFTWHCNEEVLAVVHSKFLLLPSTFHMQCCSSRIRSSWRLFQLYRVLPGLLFIQLVLSDWKGSLNLLPFWGECFMRRVLVVRWIHRFLHMVTASSFLRNLFEPPIWTYHRIIVGGWILWRYWMLLVWIRRFINGRVWCQAHLTLSS